MIKISDPVKDYLKRRANELGSQKAVAEEIGISPSHLSDVLSNKRNLGEDVLEQLGFEKVIVHVKSSNVPEVVRAIETAQAEAAHLDGIKKRIVEPKVRQIAK